MTSNNLNNLRYFILLDILKMKITQILIEVVSYLHRNIRMILIQIKPGKYTN